MGRAAEVVRAKRAGKLQANPAAQDRRREALGALEVPVERRVPEPAAVLAEAGVVAADLDSAADVVHWSIRATTPSLWQQVVSPNRKQ
jgi:hypothetical protein